ncbi:mechanosensitive ion channel [bacterium]|nr:mechanosensitive ion channel [bacterium]
MKWKKLTEIEWGVVADKAIGFSTEYGLKLLVALLIFLIGKWFAKKIQHYTQKVLLARKVDETIVKFAGNILYIALFAMVILAALSKLGIQTTSFVAIFGAAGLAIGLALQGSLSNFAAGFLMIIFRPFSVGDFIEGAGTLGVVQEIQVFTTILTTPDNKQVIIPNAQLTSGNIINYSSMGTRRIDLVVGIGYGDDIKAAKEIVMDVFKKDSRILKEPAPVVVVGELGDSSVNFNVRPWVNVSDYWGVYSDTLESIKYAFDEKGISIPFPQQDVHLFTKKES